MIKNACKFSVSLLVPSCHQNKKNIQTSNNNSGVAIKKKLTNLIFSLPEECEQLLYHRPEHPRTA
jgi:hypothetical protein